MISQCFLGSLIRNWIKISQFNKPASPLYSSLMKLHKKPQYLCLYCEYVCVIKCVLLFLLWGAMENGFAGVITAFAESTLFSSARRNLAMMHGKSIAVSKRWIWFSAQHAPKRFHLCLGKHIEIKHAEWICLEGSQYWPEKEKQKWTRKTCCVLRPKGDKSVLVLAIGLYLHWLKVIS